MSDARKDNNMIMWLWKYIRGYVIIEVSGFSTERFINLASNKGIMLTDLKKKDDMVYLSVSLKALEMLKECEKKTRCKIRIVEKKGLPFQIKKYNNRKIFFCGIVLFLLIIYTLSLFVWSIGIEGYDLLNESVIRQYLVDENCEIGTLKMKVDCDQLEKKILKQFKEISWISITLEGCNVSVKIVETIPKPEVDYNDGLATNIISDKEGIIESIITRSGTPKVKIGDVVLKGDVLISSEVENINEIIETDPEQVKKQVKADGDILAKTYLVVEEVINMNYNEKRYTGNVYKNHEICLGDNRFNFSSKSNNYTSSDKICYYNQINILGYKLPIKYITIEYWEYENLMKKHQVPEAKKIITTRVEKIKNKYLEEGGIIANQEDIYKEENNKLTQVTTLSIIEKIGIPKLADEFK